MIQLLLDGPIALLKCVARGLGVQPRVGLAVYLSGHPEFPSIGLRAARGDEPLLAAALDFAFSPLRAGGRSVPRVGSSPGGSLLGFFKSARVA